MGITQGSLTDVDGNGITSQQNGSQQAIDVGVNVAGIQVDPRDIRVLDSGTDSVTITGSVDVTSSALPTGAATEAKQDVGNSSLASIDSKLNTLGQKDSANSVPVVISSDQSPVSIKSSPGSLTDSSSTVGTTSTQIMAANANRRYLFIQNISNKIIGLNFGTTATIGSSGTITLNPGASFVMEGFFVSSEAIHLVALSNGTVFTAKEA